MDNVHPELQGVTLLLYFPNSLLVNSLSIKFNGTEDENVVIEFQSITRIGITSTKMLSLT